MSILPPSNPGCSIQPAAAAGDQQHTTRRYLYIKAAKEDKKILDAEAAAAVVVAPMPRRDLRKIPDIQWSFKQYKDWDDERRLKLYQRIICVPREMLNAGLCKKAFALAKLLGKRLSASFMARKKELELVQAKQRIEQKAFIEANRGKLSRRQMKHFLAHGYKPGIAPGASAAAPPVAPGRGIAPATLGGAPGGQEEEEELQDVSDDEEDENEDFEEGEQGHFGEAEPRGAAAGQREPPLYNSWAPALPSRPAAPVPRPHKLDDFIEPLEDDFPAPGSSALSKFLDVDRRPDDISSKINSLLNKFLPNGAPAGMPPPTKRFKPEQQQSSMEQLLRVPSPVDFGSSPWSNRPLPAPIPEAIPPEEIAKADNYRLEEPRIKMTKKTRFPGTVQEIERVADMVLLCQLRDAPSVCRPFIHPTTLPLLRMITQKLGNGFNLQEVTKSANVYAPPSKGSKVAARITTHVWIQGIAKLATLGEAVDTNLQTAMDYAHASCLAALVYMMVIPYQLVLAVQKAGEEYIPLAVYNCKQRIKELIAVARDPFYGQLLLHEGAISECSHTTKESWANFINRMRHMGMDYWQNNKLKVPVHLLPFPVASVPGFYFECLRDKEPANWDNMVPNSYDVIPFDLEDFMYTFSCSRFSCSAAEAGLLPPESYTNGNQAASYQLKHNIPTLPKEKFDPIVHLPFRDLLFNYGATVLNPMLTLFTVKYIGHRWGRRLIIKHQLVIDVDPEGKESWKHVIQLSFDGIPYFFLGARCAKENFSSALVHACSIIAQQLAAMMIIPRELCELLESRGRSIVAAVIYGCRRRFAAFESLMRNPMFASLIVQETAELELTNPLYKLAEFFYWRMRNTGWAYWMENRLIKVPMGMLNTKDLPSTSAFFQFQEFFDTADWTLINSPKDVYDNFDVKSLCPEDRFPAHWEGGGWVGQLPEVNQADPYHVPAPAPASQPAEHFQEPGTRELQDALISEFRIPLYQLTAEESEAMLNIVRSLAGMGMTILQMNVQTERLPGGGQRYHCEMAWAGELGWILNARYVDERESALQYGAAWILYKVLVRMGMVPPGLYKFVANNEARLPYVLSALAPFFSLLESILPTYTSRNDAQSRDYLVAEMHHLAVLEWSGKGPAIVLPPELLPTLKETHQLPFIRSETMGFKDYEEWNRKSSMYQKKAEILDLRHRGRTGGQQSQPGVKIGRKRFNPADRRDASMRPGPSGSSSTRRKDGNYYGSSVQYF